MSVERSVELAQHPDCLGCQPNEIVKAELGGSVYESRHWRVSHVIGPFGEGTMVVEPKRHVSDMAFFNTSEEQEAIQVFRKVASAVKEVTGAERVYMNSWGHGPDSHIHWVFQPMTKELMETYGGLAGPELQAAMIRENKPLDKAKATELARRIRDRIREMEAVG